MLSLVFTVSGKYDLLKEALASVPAACEGLDTEVEVVVVDSGVPGAPTASSNGYQKEYDVRADLRVDLPGCVVRHLAFRSEPFNLHKQWNFGLKVAQGDVIGLFNDDVVFGPRALMLCYQAIDRGLLGACYPTCFNGAHERALFDNACRGNIPANPTPEGPEEIRGYAFIFSSATVSRVGLFDEQFRFYYGEDDYACRLRQHGLGARQIAGAYLYHAGQGTTSFFGAEHWHPAMWLDSHNFPAKWRGDDGADATSAKVELYHAPLRSRTEVINWVAQMIEAKTYLEIGVDNPASNFDLIEVSNKLGVDPARQDRPADIRGVPSDAFFTEVPQDRVWDLIFVDGDHAYAQVRKDVDNALAHLAEGGVLIMHDVNPTSEQMQEGDAPVGIWCGQAWKVLVELRRTDRWLNICTLAFDHGVGVIRRGSSAPQEMDDLPLTYANLEANRDAWLNSVTPEAFRLRFAAPRR